METAQDTQNADRLLELDRRIKLAEIEKDCLALLVAESKKIIVDPVEYQRLRTRLSRLKIETGKDIRIAAAANGATLTRYEDEPVN